MNQQSEASKIMNDFIDKMEEVLNETAKKLDNVDQNAMTLGEVEAISARSDKLQEKFESMGV